MTRFGKNEITRRGFIEKIGQSVAGVSVAGKFLREASSRQLGMPDPPVKKLGWAIVGLGNLSINEILPAFANCEKSKVVALVSGHPDKANKLALQYGVAPKNIYNYQNYDSIRDNAEVDIIYIVLPNGLHAEYAVRGLAAGKHVLTEKPMANTPAECQQMIDAARNAGRKLMVAYRCRYEPYNQEAIRVARSHELGPTKVILADHGFNIGDPTQWRLRKDLAGGGSLMDIGIYSLQAARYLTGEEPTEVNAAMYNTPGDPRFKEVEETINFQLRFPSGVLANCTSSYGCGGQNHYRLVGTEGWLEMDPATIYRGLRMRVHRGNVTEERELPVRNHFALEMDHMSGCVVENKEPLTSGEEGLRDLRVMMAIYEAARAEKTIKL